MASSLPVDERPEALRIRREAVPKYLYVPLVLSLIHLCISLAQIIVLLDVNVAIRMRKSPSYRTLAVPQAGQRWRHPLAGPGLFHGLPGYKSFEQ